MYLVGLTGGIAAGKSTAANRLADHGAVIVDADLLARDAVAPGTSAFAKIAKTWPQVITEDGSLNRTALGEVVFSDDEARKTLESFVHPEVHRLAQDAITSHSESSIVIYVVPLLVEAAVDLPFDYVVTVETSIDEQMRRLVETRGLTMEQAKARLSSQVSSAARANHADEILNSNQSLAEFLSDVDALWHRLALKARNG